MDSSSILEAIHSPEFLAGFASAQCHISNNYREDFQIDQTLPSSAELTYPPDNSHNQPSDSFQTNGQYEEVTHHGPFSSDVCKQQPTISPDHIMPRTHWRVDDPDIVQITKVQPYMNYPPGYRIESHSESKSSQGQAKLTYTATNYTFVEGNGGHTLMHVDGYKFYKSNVRKTATIWTCAGKTKHKCKKRLRQTASAVTISEGYHTHQADTMQTQVDLFVESVRKRVRTELNSSIKDIYDSQARLYQTTGAEAKAILEAAPTSEFIMSSMKRARRKVLPLIPKTLEDINFKLCDLAQHILIEDGDTEKIVVIGTSDLFRHVCTSELLHMDGTFKSSPSLYAQLFVIHGTAHDMLWPLLFCLLPGKTQALYTRLFRLLADHAKGKGLVLSPRCIHIDFEKAIANSLQKVFSGSTVKGCFFHFSQCVFRKIKKVGLGTDYNILSSTCRAVLRRLFYIPFLPVEDMADAFEEIADESRWVEEGTLLPEQITKIRQVMTYYRKHWITGMRLERFNVWSVMVRTNNKAEAFNNSLNKKLKPHPNVYALVRFLGEDQNLNTEIGIMQAAKGAKVCKQRRIYRVRDELIEEAKEWLREEVYTPVEYVDRISLLYDQKRRAKMLRDSAAEEKQAAPEENATQKLPIATPIPAAVRRKGRLRQYCRLPVPRPRMSARTFDSQAAPQPKNEHQLQAQIERECCAPNRITSAHTKASETTASDVNRQTGKASSRHDSYNSLTNKLHVGKPTNGMSKVGQSCSSDNLKAMKHTTKPGPHRNDTCQMPAHKPNHEIRGKHRTKPLDPTKWKTKSSYKKRRPLLTPYAVPDTLIPATPLWLEQRRRLSKSNKRSITQTSKPMAKKSKTKISLEEALRLVLSDGE